MSVYSQRHSSSKREPKNPRATEGHGAEHKIPMKEDEAEHLASKILQVGSDYISSKTEHRFSDDEVQQGPSAITSGADPYAVSNKVIKEGAREMARAAKHVEKGSMPALAQSVAAHKDDPKHVDHIVAAKIRERLAAEEEHALHHQFQGVNPTKGPNNTKLRHHIGVPGHEYISAEYKREGNPDVQD